MPAEKCVEELKSKLAKHELSLKEDMVSITTDGATEQKNSNTVDTETSDSDFEESESDTDNEDNDNVIVEDIANEDEILTHQELLPIIDECEFDLIFRTVSSLLPIKLAPEALCWRDSNLLAAKATINFMLQSPKEQYTSLSEELYTTLKNRTEERHTEMENVLRYLHNYNDFKNENKKEEKRLTPNQM
ncbi:hypothetical protein TNCV_2336841 [Trichonephila clavipes]|nr:hypothetical protein TNCV_2336841 [Trichonephila clavipes]